ncbi:hypothetical protein ACLB2K_013355 [Fragaria x ananassa]
MESKYPTIQAIHNSQSTIPASHYIGDHIRHKLPNSQPTPTVEPGGTYSKKGQSTVWRWHLDPELVSAPAPLGIVGSTRGRALMELIRHEKPRILFLSETLCSDKQLETLRVKVRKYSPSHVDVTIGTPNSQEEWRLTGIYGYARTADSSATWALMRRLASQYSLLWLLVGVFNEILMNSEKSGGAVRRLAQMQAFREATTECALIDMGALGSLFTWADHQTKERLDRSLWNEGLRDLFPRSSTTHMHPSTSDHSPLLVEICTTPTPHRCRRRLFRFDQVWAAHPECETVNEEKKALNTKLQELLSAEETIWIQRSKSLWLKVGDRNTAFFHRRASNRKQRNTIKGLNNSNGVWVTKPNEIEEIVTSYYNSLFDTEGVNENALNSILNTVQSKVTPAMNHDLLTSYQDSEIKTALFQMHPSKAPGPDGMSPFFFQKYWHIVGRDVCIAVKSFLSSGVLFGDLNFTLVTLIPKVEEDFGQQGDFSSPKCVPERLISDNTLVATEVAHFLHTNRTGKDDHFSLKFDISKAYDRLEWEFVRCILLKLGFATEWVELIMATLTTVSHSFLVNGEVCGLVRPKRGIRQRDPLSPYLFILCAEGLSSLIQHLATSQGIQGMQLSSEAPLLHHLLFADDSLLFGTAT